jgi:endoglucanase
MFAMAIDATSQVPFKKGVNLTNWFQTSSAKQIQFTKFTRQDFVNIKNLGCDVVRLPINLHYMTNGAPAYTIDPIFFIFLDSAVAWAESLHIYLLLDNHSFDPNVNTDPNIGVILKKVWGQMANHYKDRSSYIFYEVLNEPHGLTTQVWGQVQQSVIDTIRTIDTKHTIVVGASGYNSYNELANLPVYSDTNLLYTFHFCDPFMFTHQGASWASPSMELLAGVPFPYDAAKMPACPTVLKGTWVESSLNNYMNDGTVAKVKSLIDVAVNFKTARNVNIFCGEFGVYMLNSSNDDRVLWYDTVRNYLEKKGIPWTMWDYKGGFGLFKKGSSFDIRFLDKKTTLVDGHPWRMGTTVNETMATWNKKWYHVRIPLSSLIDEGAWDSI